MNKPIYCDHCYNQLNSVDDYKIIDRIKHDDCVRICKSCEQEDGI